MPNFPHSLQFYILIALLFITADLSAAVEVPGEEVEDLSVLDHSMAKRSSHLILTIGHTKIDEDAFEDEGVSFKLGLGLQYSDWLSSELYFIYYGEATQDSIVEEKSIEGQALVFQVVGLLPVTYTINFMGKVGMAKWDFDYEHDSTVVDIKEEFGDKDIIYGAGFVFDIDHDSSVRLEYEITEYDFEGIGKFDFNVISVGFQHFFQ